MIETVLIGHDPNVPKPVEEYKRSELITLVTRYRLRDRPEASYILTLEIYSRLVEDAPYKS